MRLPKETLLPTRIDDIQDFESLREYLKQLLRQMEEEHTGIYEDLKSGRDADKVDGKDAADLKHGISTDDNTAIKVKVGSFTCPASTGNYSVTGVPFKPRCVEFMVGRAVADEFQNTRGWMDYNGNQGTTCQAFWITGPAGYSEYSVSHAIFTISEAGTTLIAATYISMDNDGFTINFANVNTNFKILWKAAR